MRGTLLCLLWTVAVSCSDRPAKVGVDGSTRTDGVVADTGSISDGAAGCSSNLDCKSNVDPEKSGYCHFETGCGATGAGQCRPLPEACLGDCPGVCGCDGKVYCNACEANAVGVSVDDEGDCAIGAGCDSNDECGTPGEYCHIEVGCDGPGECRPVPDNCSTIGAPVCGCDGVVYGNECGAHFAGTNVLHEGECGSTCSSDAECVKGAEWCVEGVCIPCDNSGLACDIACIEGWTTYVRHGCSPCECAPFNQCSTDADCPHRCYAGAFCWDWCPPGDPSCCQGNICATAGCTSPPPVGCFVRGCPQGQECVAEGCASTGCDCSGSDWGCDDDCGGGVCK